MTPCNRLPYMTPCNTTTCPIRHYNTPYPTWHHAPQPQQPLLYGTMQCKHLPYMTPRSITTCLIWHDATQAPALYGTMQHNHLPLMTPCNTKHLPTLHDTVHHNHLPYLTPRNTGNFPIWHHASQPPALYDTMQRNHLPIWHHAAQPPASYDTMQREAPAVPDMGVMRLLTVCSRVGAGWEGMTLLNSGGKPLSVLPRCSMRYLLPSFSLSYQ